MAGFALTVLFACKNSSQTPNQMSEQEVNEHLTNANKIRVQNESKTIEEFIAKRNYKMVQTGTGLRYEKYVTTESKVRPVAHDEVTIAYNVFLLDGRKCYSTDSVGPLKFHILEGQEARGLEEGLLLMAPGEKSRMVIPMHLAYGLSGDGDRIPPGASLFIDVELVKIGQ